jgi:hypothetical protein
MDTPYTAPPVETCVNSRHTRSTPDGRSALRERCAHRADHLRRLRPHYTSVVSRLKPRIDAKLLRGVGSDYA